MEDKAKIQELEQKLALAMARISELEALLLKLTTPKNSRNSHLSPSTDLSRKNVSLREKSDNPVGGQSRHKGHNLKISQTPDKIESLYPNFCNNCGNPLAGSDFELSSRRQVIDIPPIAPITTEYQCFSTQCKCGHHQSASFPDGVAYPIQYGPNIQTLAIYQSCFQYVPFGRLQDFFAKVCQVPLSKGTIENFIRRTAKKTQPVYEKLRQTIAISFFVGSDETSFKLNGGKGWFWLWQNSLVTYIVAATSRSKSVISDTFPEGLPKSILCSDRLAAQLSTVTKGSQICLAHLLRDLNYLIDSEKNGWATDFKALLKDAIALKEVQGAYLKDDPRVINIEQRANLLLAEAMAEKLLTEPLKNKETITFFRGMVKLREALFPFLYHPQIPFDNNCSERAIRMVKVKIKVSGQFKSLHQDFAVIRSVIGTAIKNGQSVLHAISAMVKMPLNTAG